MLSRHVEEEEVKRSLRSEVVIKVFYDFLNFRAKVNVAGYMV